MPVYPSIESYFVATLDPMVRKMPPAVTAPEDMHLLAVVCHRCRRMSGWWKGLQLHRRCGTCGVEFWSPGRFENAWLVFQITKDFELFNNILRGTAT